MAMPRWTIHEWAQQKAYDEDSYRELKESISTRGIHIPIIVWRDQVVDGWHRYRAMCDLDIDPTEHATILPDDTPQAEVYELIIDLNLHRRHLEKGQRTMLMIAAAEKLNILKAGGKGLTDESRKALAQRAGVSGELVRQAKAVKDRDPVAAAQVAAGEQSLIKAYKDVTRKKLTNDGEVLDGARNFVPAILMETFTNRWRFEELCLSLSKMFKTVEELATLPGGERIDKPLIKAELKAARSAIADAMPYAVCPLCDGEACRFCKGTGWLGKPSYKVALAEKAGRNGAPVAAEADDADSDMGF